MTDLTVGGVAARTGITVRTLHHYHAIGLVCPSGRTDAGYRLYSEADIRRLETTVLLRGLGLSLAEVASVVTQGSDELLHLLEQHLEQLQERLTETHRLAARLDQIAHRLQTHSPQSLEDAFETIRIVTTFERYFGADLLEDLRATASTLGEAHISQIEAEWPRLIAAIRQEMHLGTAPGDERVLALARRWGDLVDAFVSGRPDVADSAGRMLAAEPALRQRAGLDDELMDYVARASALAHLPLSGS